MNCPTCGKAKFKGAKVEERLFGVSLGLFPAEVCGHCGESFTDETTTRLIETAAKKKGLWGLGVKTKIARTGNSLAIRIPQKIAKFLKLKEGEETYLHPEKDKLIIET